MDQEVTPPTNLIRRGQGNTIMPSPPTANDFNQFQELFERIADSLQISLEEVTESQHKLLDILQTSTSSKIALPINEALMDPVKAVQQTPATIPPTCKRTDKKYYVPSKDKEFLFSHPSPN